MTTEISSSPNIPAPRRRGIRFWAWLSAFALAVVIIVVVVMFGRPERPERIYARGRAALLAGDRPLVLREAENLIQIPGYEPYGWLLKGLMLTRVGKLDEAIIYLGKAAEHDALALEANTAAAQCFYQSGLYLQAIQVAQLALQLDPAALDARRWLAAAYYDLGANSHAVNELEQISEQAPTDPRPDRLLGLIAKDGEQFPRAIGHYQESLKRDPLQPDAQIIRTELAESQIKLGKFADSLATLSECEHTAIVLTLQAECQNGLGNFDEAVSLLRRAIKLDPRYFTAKLTLGTLLLDRGQIEDAKTILTDAVRTGPPSSKARFQLSQALRRSNQIDAADEELRQMQQIQAMEREFSDLHDTAASQPNNADIRFRIGELAQKLGKPELASVWLRAAVAINPSHPRARAALSQMNGRE